jgi:hypothetical protein
MEFWQMEPAHGRQNTTPMQVVEQILWRPDSVSISCFSPVFFADVFSEPQGTNRVIARPAHFAAASEKEQCIAIQLRLNSLSTANSLIHQWLAISPARRFEIDAPCRFC